MSDVPSNLIPTRVTQLPVAPVADENSLMMIVYQGNNYQIRVGDLLSVAGVPLTRQVIAGTGLQGGGQLSSNVTLSIAPGGVGSTQLANSGVTPGVYGTATSVPVFTVDATGRVTAATTIPVVVSGYVPESRQVIAGNGLSGGGALNNNVTLTVNLSNSAPSAGFQAGVAGVSNNVSRADHQHPAVNLGVDDEVDGILGLGNGGTAKSLVPDAGAIIWCGADGLYVGPVGAAGQLLQSAGANEYVWVNASTLVVARADNLSGGDANKLVYQTAADNTGFVDAPSVNDTFLKWDGIGFVWASVAGAGTVTSVDGDGGATGLTVSGGPITSAGTLTLGGTLNAESGGTGLAAYTAGDLLYATGTAALDKLPIGSGTYLLSSSGTAPQWSDPTAVTVGTATNVAGGAAGALPYNSNTGTTTFLNLGTTDYVLTAGATAPQYVAQSTLSVGAASTATNVAGGAANRLVYNTGTATTSFVVAPTIANTYLEWSGSAFQWSANPLGSVTSVDASGGTTGLTFSGGPITTSGTLTMAGTLAVANGGTGATDAPGARSNLSAAVTGANNDITSLVSVTGGISSPDFIQFDAALSPLPTDATAKLYYNNDDQFQTLAFQMNGAVIQKVGEEQYFRIKCQGSITKGQVVSFAGTLGASGGLIGKAATGLTADQSNYILGIAAETGANNDWIFVTYFGEVKGLNTTGGAESWVDGTILYYNPAVTGGLTKNKPTTPNAIAIIAAVVHADASNGILSVRPTFGSVLGGTDGNVQFGTLTGGDVIVYDGTDMRWENAAQSSLVAGAATNISGGSTGALPYNTGAGATTFLNLGTTDYVLTAGATAPQYTAQSSLAVGSATNVAGGTAGALPYNTGAGATTFLGLGTLNHVLTAGATAPQYTAQSSLSVGTATNLAGGVASNIPYQSGVGATSFLANGTAGQVLLSNGASAPSWGGVSGGTF